MVHAYILIQTEVGKAAQVAKTISEITGVSKAEDVTGPYDVIVRAEAETVDDLGHPRGARAGEHPGDDAELADDPHAVGEVVTGAQGSGPCHRAHRVAGVGCAPVRLPAAECRRLRRPRKVVPWSTPTS